MRGRRTPAVALLLLLAATATGCSGSGAEAPSTTAAAPAPSSAPASPAAPAIGAALDALEAEYDARIGLVAVDTGDERILEHRADERFRFASSSKALAAGALLARTGPEDLERVVTWSDVVDHSPVTGPATASGLPLGEVAEAAVRVSDNTAHNAVLEELGGPAGLQEALRGLGDDVTRVDRLEPELNTSTPDGLDTGTARSLSADLRALLLGGALDPDDRDLLREWMSGNTTGDALVRAGAPAGWTVLDKSGGAGGLRTDLALVERPDAAPIVIAVLTERDDPAQDYDDALVARAAAIALDALG
ncbi:class A beta-lactamase [Rathayibacter sp. SD072]|uniref:class A beta-lactamase n=1 Tax=Rathayibacter sp. SD072 TaxID=2781731 RepID=UPI001A95F650|nr:class A beta-lactamase [Rathayibacter sp. SD072]MBO0985749.1 class A beta-lactamase [Rathayibacter sp. SD072]